MNRKEKCKHDFEAHIFADKDYTNSKTWFQCVKCKLKVKTLRDLNRDSNE